MIENLIYNFKIHQLLRKFAKQRVNVVDPEKGIWVLEYSVEYNEENNNLLKTCYMRGWIEPIQDSVPTGKLNHDGTLPSGPLYQRLDTMWKLTDSGWSAIHRTHQLGVLGIFLTIISILIALKI